MTASFRQMAGIPDSTASVQDSTLLIIDAQNEYAEGALAVKDLDKSRPAIHNLLKKYRAGNGYVAHIRHEVPEGTPVFTPDTKLAKEFSELEEGMDEHKDTETVIGKKFPGSFAETDLDKFVEKSQKKKLVLCGYMAHVCVSTTAREAHQRGYEVLIVEDAVGDRDIPGASGEDVTKHALNELKDFFATTIKSSDIQ